MNRYFTTNVLRMFQNRKIYICTLGMALTLYMSGIAFIRSDGDSANLQDAFSVVSSSGFIILFYLLYFISSARSITLSKLPSILILPSATATCGISLPLTIFSMLVSEPDTIAS